jgi:dTDP-glucose 4,6-dehydratase
LVEGIFRLHFSDETRPVNIGNPDEITIGDFAEEIIALTGTDQKVVYRDLPENDPKQRQPDITRAKTVLGWEPSIDRAEGLKRTYAYFKTLSTEELHKSEHKDFADFRKD